MSEIINTNEEEKKKLTKELDELKNKLNQYKEEKEKLFDENKNLKLQIEKLNFLGLKI